MNFWCWLLGHKWFVFTPSLQTHRTCKRCGKKQKTVFKKVQTTPFDLQEWVDV